MGNPNWFKDCRFEGECQGALVFDLPTGNVFENCQFVMTQPPPADDGVVEAEDE